MQHRLLPMLLFELLIRRFADSDDIVIGHFVLSGIDVSVTLLLMQLLLFVSHDGVVVGVATQCR